MRENLRREVSIHVAAMVAPAETGEDLVADRAGGLRDLVDADAVAEQCCHGARLDGPRIRHVHCDKVHRHPAGEGQITPFTRTGAPVLRSVEPAWRI